MDHALIIGSAPCSESLRSADLSAFTRIAINRSWALRKDFDIHVGLKFMEEQHAPPKDYKLRRVKRTDYNPHLKKAGGNFLCSPSVALVAGYWAVHTQPCDTISYFGCDLVFEPARHGGRTHFYGVSDAGPLFNKHPCMRRQDLKSVRLFVWALLHRIVVLNASAEPGSLLAYPVCRLDQDRDRIFARTMASKVTPEILARGCEAFAFEERTRIAAFDGRWQAFANNPDAIAILDATLERWEPVKTLCAALQDDLAAHAGS
jgi:hypothetical protein